MDAFFSVLLPMSFSKGKQIPSFSPQSGVYFKEIVGFMVKIYYFYHKRNHYLHKVVFTKVHKPMFFLLKATQTSSLSIFYDAIY